MRKPFPLVCLHQRMHLKSGAVEWDLTMKNEFFSSFFVSVAVAACTPYSMSAINSIPLVWWSHHPRQRQDDGCINSMIVSESEQPDARRHQQHSYSYLSVHYSFNVSFFIFKRLMGDSEGCWLPLLNCSKHSSDGKCIACMRGRGLDGVLLWCTEQRSKRTASPSSVPRGDERNGMLHGTSMWVKLLGDPTHLLFFLF